MIPSEPRQDLGNPYAPPALPAPVALASGDADDQELAAFVGPRANYYLKKWRSMPRGGGFNWAAFLLAGFWLPYRKMYRAAVLFYAIILMEGALEEIVFVGLMGEPEVPSFVNSIFGLGIAIACGANANRWYYRHARKVIARRRGEGLEGEALLRALAHEGRTNVVAGLAMFVFGIASTAAILTVLDILLLGE